MPFIPQLPQVVTIVIQALKNTLYFDHIRSILTALALGHSFAGGQAQAFALVGEPPFLFADDGEALPLLMFPSEGAPEGLQNLPKLIPLYHSKEAGYDCRHRPIFPQMLKQIGDDVGIKILAPLRKMGIIIDKIEYLITDCLVVR